MHPRVSLRVAARPAVAFAAAPLGMVILYAEADERSGWVKLTIFRIWATLVDHFSGIRVFYARKDHFHHGVELLLLKWGQIVHFGRHL